MSKRPPTGLVSGGRTGVLAGLVVLALLAGCSSAPRYRPVIAPPAPTSTPAARAKIVDVVRDYIGTPYRSGGTSRRGVDCSGLVIAVYRQFEVDLPRLSVDQSRVGFPVGRNDVRPGDLVFFRTSGRESVSHVGIYVGGGRFVHASTSARQVREDELDAAYFQRRFVTARRVIDD